MPLLLLSILQSLLLSVGQMLMKSGLSRLPSPSLTVPFLRTLLSDWRLALCGVSFSAAGILWAYILRHYPLSQAYPLVSLSYVFGMLGATVFFHEQVDVIRWIGVFLIVTGSILVAQ